MCSRCVPGGAVEESASRSLAVRPEHGMTWGRAGQGCSLRCGRSTLIVILSGKIGTCRQDGAHRSPLGSLPPGESGWPEVELRHGEWQASGSDSARSPGFCRCVCAGGVPGFCCRNSVRARPARGRHDIRAVSSVLFWGYDPDNAQDQQEDCSASPADRRGSAPASSRYLESKRYGRRACADNGGSIRGLVSFHV